jgi:putative transposase
VSLLHAHLVYMTKYRRRVFTDAMLTVAEHTMRECVLTAMPNWTSSTVKATGACVRARMPGHLWSPSCFAVSRGGAPLSIIKQYIERQARPL